MRHMQDSISTSIVVLFFHAVSSFLKLATSKDFFVFREREVLWLCVQRADTTSNHGRCHEARSNHCFTVYHTSSNVAASLRANCCGRGMTLRRP